MEAKIFENKELGLRLHSWDGKRKNERVFIASEIMKQLGYKGGNNTLRNYDLEEGIDKITLFKKTSPSFLKQLSDLKSLGQRTGSVIMLYESGVWKLIMQSRKAIGIKTRNWLAREVLPSIREKGYYSAEENSLNPLSYLSVFTERKTQLDNSKSVNKKIHDDNKNFAIYHNKVHKLVSGMNAKEIQTFYNSKDSAREILRQHLPENAATIAVIDELYYKKGLSLSNIENSKIHQTLPPALKSLMECGINLI